MMKSAKARLTLARIALEEAITTSQEVMAPDAVSGSESEKIEALRKVRTTMESKRANIAAMKECVNEAMGQLHVVYELLDEPRKQAELPSYEQYLEVAVEAVSKADQFCAQLIGKKAEMEQRMADIQLAMLQSTRTEDRNHMAEHSFHSTPTIPAVTYTMPAYLPRLEIPKFSGRRADWDNFWAIFSANIHEQNISPMLKFNYLWQYLEGEARALISRYQVSEENYPEAIACLVKKYGDNDTRIEELFAEIFNSKAEWKSTKSQTELLEKISATMSQLAIKGQDVDHRMLLNTIFSKFDADIQTRALEKRADLENPRDWTWAQMQKELSGILQRRQYIEETRSKINVVQESSARRPSQPIRDSRLICMYCKRFGHQSSDCRTVKESERAAYLTKNRLCFNCGKPYHTAEICRSPPCYKCGQKHDISLCGVLTGQQRNPIPQERRNYMTRPTQPAFQQRKGQPAPNSRDAPSKKTTKSIPVAHQNVIQKRFGEKVNSKDEKRESRGHTEPNKAETLLLTGTATILGENGSKEVKILLDTGSETSFIDRSLVEELQLPIIETAQLRLKTFGSNEVTENRHKVVEVKIIDRNGEILTFQLYDSPILTAHTTTATLTKEDLRVVKQKGIHLSTKLDERQCPAQILLGCDYLWDVMGRKKQKLPSGLYLISTRLGYMISGRQSGFQSPISAWQPDGTLITSKQRQEDRHQATIESMEAFYVKIERKIDKCIDVIEQQARERMEECEKMISALMEESLMKTVDSLTLAVAPNLRTLEERQQTSKLEDVLTPLEDDVEVANMQLRKKEDENEATKEKPCRGKEDIKTEENSRSWKNRTEREFEKDESPAKKARSGRSRTPFKLSQAKANLKGLLECRQRQIGNAKVSLCNVGARFVGCAFCRQRRKHDTDAGTTFTTVNERRALIKDEDVCGICFKKRSRERWKLTRRCGYCRDQNHHESLCLLPEKRREVVDITNTTIAMGGSVRERTRTNKLAAAGGSVRERTRTNSKPPRDRSL